MRPKNVSTHSYSINEYCSALIDGKWRQAIVMEKKGKFPKFIYNLMFPDERVMETGADKFRDVPVKLMARVQVYTCSHCGNWLDPEELPVLGTLDGSKAEVTLRVKPVCPHNGMPYTMDKKPWTEVPGISAVGGLHEKRFS